ncbi:MAG: hypothetical protein ACNI27_13220 [Desulfovibrio sp.]
MKSLTVFFLSFLLICCCALTSFAGDMDDGVGGFDDQMGFDNDLSKKTNVNYMKVKAKAKARNGGDSITGIEDGDVNVGSANITGNVHGDVIVIQEGDVNVVK